MKKASLFMSACALIIAFGCGNTPESADTQSNFPEEASFQSQVAKMETPKVYNLSVVELQEYAKEMASNSHKEILMAQLAMEKAKDADIRAFAEEIRNDHQNSVRQLENIVAETNWYLPDTLMRHHQRMIDQIRTLEGREFDMSYLRSLTRAYDTIINAYEKVAEKGGDSRMTDWARNYLPVMRQHLERSQMMVGRMEEAS